MTASNAPRFAERDHWLSVTEDPDWKLNHIHGTGVSLDETIAAIVLAFPDNPERILEIGCGYGRLASEIAKWYPDCDVIGTDISPAILAEGIPGPSYACTDNLVGYRGLDAIYSVTVFQHLPADSQRFYIGESYDALRPGGILRVQFVEGECDDFLNHCTSRPDMAEWVVHAGFSSSRFVHGLAHQQWTWITAVK
jgi:trans-aconitate 2-methyltransferase